MHRGGTSLITRSLKVLGVELGDRVLPPDQGINDSGYWEDMDLTQLNEDMLHALGTDWHHLVPLPVDLVERLRDKGFLLAAVELLRKKSSSTSVFGFKDPRVSLLLSFWKQVFAQCDLDVSYVVAIRNPISVIRSLERRDRFELEKSALLWLIHTVSLVEGAIHEPVVAVIDYDRLMQAPDHELCRLASIMNLTVNPREMEFYREEFLQKHLRHTEYKPDDLALNAFTGSLVHEFYVRLLEVARGEKELNSSCIQAQVAQSRQILATWTCPLGLMDPLYHFKRDGARKLEEANRSVDASQAYIESLRNQIATLESALAERDAEMIRREAAAAAARTCELERETERNALWVARSSDLEGQNQALRVTISAETQRSMERDIEVGRLRDEAAGLTNQIRNLNDQMARIRQVSGQEAQLIAAQDNSLRVVGRELALSVEERKRLQERCNSLEDAARRTAQIFADREQELASLRKDLSLGTAKIGFMEKQAVLAERRRIHDQKKISELEFNATQTQKHLANKATVILKLTRDLGARVTDVAQACEKIAERDAVIATLRGSLNETIEQREVLSQSLRNARENVELLERQCESSDQMTDTLAVEVKRIKQETDELRRSLDDKHLEFCELERRYERLNTSVDDLKESQIANEFEITRFKKIAYSRKVDIEQREAALLKSDQMIEGLSKSMNALRSEIEESIELMPYTFIADDNGKQHSLELNLLLQRDGSDFVREAYRQVLLREPDAGGGGFYSSRLRSGISKWQILQELSDSEEGRRANCKLEGLQTALRLRRATAVPVLGRFIGKLFGVECAGPVESQVRASRQRLLDVYQSITDRVVQMQQDLKGLEQCTADRNVADSPKVSGVQDHKEEPQLAHRSSVILPGARPKLQPVVFQFEYAQTASPASVGLSSDSRELAAGYRRIRMVEGASGTVLCDIDFTANGNARDFVLFGFSDTEEWGTWSLGKKSALVVWLATNNLGSIEISIEARPFESAFAAVQIAVTSSLRHRGDLVIGRNQAPCCISIVTDNDNPSLMFFGGNLNADCANNVSLTEVIPKCSIIILNFNKPLLSLLSARSVLSANIARPYEVIIVDNGSSQENYSVLTSADVPVRIHRIPCNRYFGEGNNLGAEVARGEYLIFLNNDAFLAPGAVDVLLTAFESDPNCAIAGPVFRYPDGRLQEAGAFVGADGIAEQRGKFDATLDVGTLPEFGYVDYVSAACLMIRADRFNDLGGFNYRFDPAYYEDTDLCFRVHLREQRVVLARDAVCFHIENATTADRRSAAGVVSTVDHNRKVFLSIWGAFLSGRSSADLPPLLIPRNVAASRGQRTFVVRRERTTQATYSPYPLVPGGGERYILGATRALNRLGPSTLVTPDPYSSLRVNNVMFDLGLPVGDIGTASLHEAEQWTFERAIAMGNEIYPSLCLPAERNFFHCQFPFPLSELGARDLKAGMNILAQYEKVIVNSEFTRRAYEIQLRKLGRTADIEVVNPPVATARLLSLPRKSKPWILSVGRFSAAGHSKRQDVLIKALRATSKSFRNEWKLILCGNVPNNSADRAYFRELQESVGNDIHVEFILSPPTSLVDSLYAQASIYAHACGFSVREPEEYWKCEHFGITLVEAMVAGCQVTCYEVGGGSEIISAVGAGAVYGSIDELVSKFQMLGERHADDGARIRAAKLFGDDAFYDRLTSVVA